MARRGPLRYIEPYPDESRQKLPCRLLLGADCLHVFETLSSPWKLAYAAFVRNYISGRFCFRGSRQKLPHMVINCWWGAPFSLSETALFTHTQCLPNTYDQPRQRSTLTLGSALHGVAAADDLTMDTDMDEFNNPDVWTGILAPRSDDGNCGAGNKQFLIFASDEKDHLVAAGARQGHDLPFLVRYRLGRVQAVTTMYEMVSSRTSYC